MNDLEKKSIECLKSMPIEETTYQVARNVVLDYITNLQERIKYLERNNDRREDTIIGLRQELASLNENNSKNN